MILTIPVQSWPSYLSTVADRHIPDGVGIRDSLEAVFQGALDRLGVCFAGINRKYYRVDGKVSLDHLNSDHMATLLYFLSSELIRHGDERAALKLFYLNKSLHGIDLFPEVRMPSVFLLVHPLGTVLGRAQYGDFLVVYQGVTVGTSRGSYPRLGNGNILFSGAKVLDDVVTGDNVIFGANSFARSGRIPGGSLVVGSYPNLCVKPSSAVVSDVVFNGGLAETPGP